VFELEKGTKLALCRLLKSYRSKGQGNTGTASIQNNLTSHIGLGDGELLEGMWNG
jgi:hypothetical protein